MCKKKIDFICNNRMCQHKDSVKELYELGYVEKVDENYIVIWCPCCGEQTYICFNKGYKSHLIEI